MTGRWRELRPAAGRQDGAGTPPDERITRLISRTSTRLRPSPAYRQRLRGEVLNQYVADREGLVRAPRDAARRQMGRLGRSVLYATFALGVGVSAVGAASTTSLPGDALYPVKRQIEAIRMEIAPASVRPALAAMALDERIGEVELLAAAGRWQLVDVGMREVDGAEALLTALGGPPVGDTAEAARHVQRLTALLGVAPVSAQTGLEHALAASQDLAVAGSAGGRDGDGTTSHGNRNDQGASAGTTGGQHTGGAAGTAKAGATSSASSSPHGAASPSPAAAATSVDPRPTPARVPSSPPKASTAP